MQELKIILRELVITDKDSGETVTIRTLQTVKDIARNICGAQSDLIKERADDEYEAKCIKK